MTAEEIMALIDEEERRLGVGSEKFREHHEEIMKLIEHMAHKNM